MNTCNVSEKRMEIFFILKKVLKTKIREHMLEIEMEKIDFLTVEKLNTLLYKLVEVIPTHVMKTIHFEVCPEYTTDMYNFEVLDLIKVLEIISIEKVHFLLEKLVRKVEITTFTYLLKNVVERMEIMDITNFDITKTTVCRRMEVFHVLKKLLKNKIRENMWTMDLEKIEFLTVEKLNVLLYKLIEVIPTEVLKTIHFEVCPEYTYTTDMYKFEVLDLIKVLETITIEKVHFLLEKLVRKVPTTHFNYLLKNIVERMEVMDITNFDITKTTVCRRMEVFHILKKLLKNKVREHMWTMELEKIDFLTVEKLNVLLYKLIKVVPTHVLKNIHFEICREYTTDMYKFEVLDLIKVLEVLSIEKVHFLLEKLVRKVPTTTFYYLLKKVVERMEIMDITNFDMTKNTLVNFVDTIRADRF